MAITMSQATVDSSKRDELLAHSVSESVIQGDYVDSSLETAAGISSDFAESLSGAIDSYIADINQTLNKLDSLDATIGFKGTAVAGAIETFIENVKAVSLNYTTALQNAEVQIVNSVKTAYQTQDADLSGNLSTDSSTIANEKVNI